MKPDTFLSDNVVVAYSGFYLRDGILAGLNLRTKPVLRDETARQIHWGIFCVPVLPQFFHQAKGQ
jgi:hypothetical protein